MAMDLDTTKKKRKGRSAPEMNVTPLVDVVLVLLIIFMVVMPSMHRTFWLHVPAESREQPEPPREEQPPIVVTVDARGALRINQDVYADATFGVRLRRMLAASGERKIYFDADDAAPFERAVEAMDLARGAGASSIAVTTHRLR